MPQLSQIGEIYASQLFWLAIVFALIYFGIGKAMVPRIERTMDDRQARIGGDIAAAERARTDAASAQTVRQTAIDAARHSAQALTVDAKEHGAAAAASALKASDARLAEQLASAEARVGRAKQSALVEIDAFLVEAVGDIIAKVSGRVPDTAAVAAAVRTELTHG